MSLPDGSTETYHYDTLNRLSSITDSLIGIFNFGYDNLSRRTSLARPNGVNTSYGYDSLSHLLSVLHQNGTNTLDGATYIYDPAGNRTSKTNLLNNITEQYTYDALYQLTQVVQGATTTESYSYDAVGNRLSSLVMSYNYNTSNELTSTTAATFTYDNNGNTLTKTSASGTTQYGWDFENRLMSAVVPGVGTVTFRYDPFGRRIQKAGPNGTVTYVYDGANALEEVDASGNLLAHYQQGMGIDEPLAELRSGTSAFYERDGLGSISSLSAPTATISNSYVYDAFGNASALTGSFTNPYRYTARDYDTETGLQYSRARYYDPQAGRFISEDPLGFLAGPNRYGYVSNRPTNLWDPNGLRQYPPNFIGPIQPGDSYVSPLVYNQYLAYEDCLDQKTQQNWKDSQCDSIVKGVNPKPKIQMVDPEKPGEGVPVPETATAQDIMNMGMTAWLKAAKECFQQFPLAALYDQFKDLDPGIEITGPTLDEKILEFLTGVPLSK